MSYPSTTFPRLRSMLRVIRYIHRHPRCSVSQIVKVCGINHATFYRFKHAVGDLGVKIVFDGGYVIRDYGLLNPERL